MRSLFYLIVVVAPLLLAGCAGAYFRTADDAPMQPLLHEATALPFDEYWTGVVFNGNKIGFTHLAVRPLAKESLELRSHAALRFHFLTIDKAVTLKAVDRVGHDLTIRDFDYDYDLDGNRLEIAGRVSDGMLSVTVRSRDTVVEQRLALAQAVYPSSVIALYPVVHGLEVGRRYDYTIYDGETQALTQVEQEVLAFERSDLFEGPAFRVRTRMHGQEVSTWIGMDGRPLLERSVNGVFLSGLESESMAKRSLALAALNKDESLLDFSIVRIDAPIARPREVSTLAIELTGLDGFPVPSDTLQACAAEADRTRCDVPAQAGIEPSRNGAARWLQSTLPAPSRDPRVSRLAREIAGARTSERERVQALIDWIQGNVEQTAVDVFSALDVLATRKAECQGNSYLYTAFARALLIPTRVVNGIVYSELVDGFVYHTWAESLVDGRWRAVDPTFGQARADATHVKLIEGESLAALAPMVSLIGRLQARVLSYE